MKKIEYHKNFLPKEIAEKRYKLNCEKDKTALILLIVINVIFSFKSISKLIDSPNEKIEVISSIEYEKERKDDLEKWLNILYKTKSYGEILNGKGELIVTEEVLNMIEDRIPFSNIVVSDGEVLVKVGGE